LMRAPFSDPEGTSSRQPHVPASRSGVADSNAGLFNSKPSGNQSLDRNRVSEVVEGKAEDAPEAQSRTWLTEIEASWTNPVFELAEPAIPSVPATSGIASLPTKCSTHRSFPISQTAQEIAGKISKTALCEAQVIAQVDKKFILAKLPVFQTASGENKATDRSLLVLVDQHAADERVRVEALMRDYFAGRMAVCTQVLTQPLRFEISAQERRLTELYCSSFAQWGIIYHVSPTKPDDAVTHQRSTLRVTRLPPSIAPRCIAEPRVLIELIRREAWRFDEQDLVRTNGLKPGDDDLHWLSRFHGCPQNILDLINSRACRSAIMFNDALSVEECKVLLSKLAGCTLPFQCAHGRPSLVPILELDTGVSTGLSADGRGGFGAAFTKWKLKKREGSV
jgi:DNA mismatch repair protein MLH3